MSQKSVGFRILTQAKYNAHIADGTIDKYTLYFTSDTCQVYRGYELMSNVIIDGTVPFSGSGISIQEGGGTIYRNYVNSKNAIRKEFYYTSLGLNTYDENDEDSESESEEPVYTFNYATLKELGGESYIKLYNYGDNWISLHISDDSLGIDIDKVRVKHADGTIENYVNETPVKKGDFVMFGSDITFDGLIEKRDNDENEYIFGDDGLKYSVIDMYKVDIVPDVYAYNENNEIRLLTEADRDDLEDEIENLAKYIIIDPDGSEGSEEPMPLSEVIKAMYEAIKALDEIAKIKPMDEDDIDELFDGSEDE